MAEYEACIMGIKAAIDMRIKFLNVYGDSSLVISHIKGEWDAKRWRRQKIMELPHPKKVAWAKKDILVD